MALGPQRGRAGGAAQHDACAHLQQLAAAAEEMSEIKKAVAPKEIARALRVTKLQQMRQAAAVAETD